MKLIKNKVNRMIKKISIASFSLLSGLSIASASTLVSPSADNNVPSKVIQIYNNSPEIIYPVIESSESQQDQWLQAYFKSSDNFVHTKVYRIYVNPQNGIPPKGSVAINVPLYSTLVNNPSGNEADQYIDWWNGARVYLYDNRENLLKVYAQDQALNNNLPVSPVDASPSYQNCQVGSHTCEPLNIYSNTVGLPLSDPYQLAEYTFGGIGDPHSISWSPEDVDYDLSYVDHVYLPVALEPYNNSTIGYTGTVMEFGTFENRVKQFVQNATWPTFTQIYQYQNIHFPGSQNDRIPGTYNVLVLSQSTGILSPAAGTQVQKLESLWTGCLNGVNPTDDPTVCPNIQIVNNLFQKNYANYIAQCPAPETSNDTLSLLQHVYGWVPFSECTGFAPGANSLAQTPGVDYNAAKKAYDALEYSSVFNPYVQFIHGSQYLGMTTSYAYSVDDAVGNMNGQGDGIVIAVGGGNGLPNPNPYNPAAVVRVNLGQPAQSDSGAPTFVKYGICADTVNAPLENKQVTLTINSVQYPCEVSLLSSDNKTYHFELLQHAPLTQADVSCSDNDNWCQAVNVDTNTKQDVDTPPPFGQVNPPSPSTANLYMATGWTGLQGQGCGIQAVDSGSVQNGGAYPFHFTASAGNCTVSLSAGNTAANLLISYDAQGNVTGATCTVAGSGAPCNIANVPFSASAVNIAPPGAQIGN